MEALAQWPGDNEQGWSDSRFLELARNGGQDEAYLLIFDHLTKLRGYLASLYCVELGGTQGVEGVVHETAWKAVENVGSYKPDRGGVLFWAWRIGVNLALDYLRSEEARHDREKIVAQIEGTEDKELLSFVHEAIERLPDPYRTILLFDLEHDGRGPASDLAKRFQVEIQTIYNWRLQARAILAPFFR